MPTLRPYRGAAVLELTVVALPLLLAGLAVLELAHWQLARSMLSYALLEAARGAQTGDPNASGQMAERFELAVLPLWRTANRSSDTETALAELQLAARAFQQQHQFPLWQIQPVVYPAGSAPIPGLILELTWWHKPWVPGMQALLRQLGRIPPPTPLRMGMARSGWLPIRQRLAIEWHNRPQQTGSWPHDTLPLIPPQFAPPVPATPIAASPPWPQQGNEHGLFRFPCRGQACTQHPWPTLPTPSLPEENELCGTVICCPDNASHT